MAEGTVRNSDGVVVAVVEFELRLVFGGFTTLVPPSDEVARFFDVGKLLDRAGALDPGSLDSTTELAVRNWGADDGRPVLAGGLESVLDDALLGGVNVTTVVVGANPVGEKLKTLLVDCGLDSTGKTELDLAVGATTERVDLDSTPVLEDDAS